MKRNISLLITIFIASTLLFAANKSKDSQQNKVKPIKEKGAATNIVKPMKKKLGKPSEVQDELVLLRRKFESEKFSIDAEYKQDLRMLKNRKKEALKALKADYNKKRARLRKKR